MRMVTAMRGAGNPDITWHYPVNLIWWYAATPFLLSPRPPSPLVLPSPF